MAAASPRCGPACEHRCRMAGVEGLEPPTPGFGDRCSSQLSYTPNAGGIYRGKSAPSPVARLVVTVHVWPRPPHQRLRGPDLCDLAMLVEHVEPERDDPAVRLSGG